MNKTAGTIVIRDRGQLTIPDKIRSIRSWASPASVVTISTTRDDEILIKPYQSTVDWDKIFSNIKKSRAIHGKGEISGADFLAKDRKSH
ncbi:MAG: hypothetical protein UU23_C0005G0010 [Candidatus Curtissbacteria bacterium GW2011_GWA1_40_9]|uniref:Uncharacterized protein n=1 Tax=Candidatus Curtissbacteria bacterium GW2011_GWA1_40_9 TaxID=1618408 RepID=A0A0G0WRF7_9BACT|nr:MAG: hypothetical protein UU23_C0005G0010 [Candidatus Curtissbacteria bacterium GW2011_GWA1_40_9]